MTRYLSQSQILDRLPVSRTTLHRLRRDGKFPAPIEISKGKLAWDEEEIDAFLKGLKASRRSEHAG